MTAKAESSDMGIHQGVKRITLAGETFYSVFDIIHFHFNAHHSKVWKRLEQKLIQLNVIAPDWASVYGCPEMFYDKKKKYRKIPMARGNTLQAILRIKETGFLVLPGYVYFLTMKEDRRFVKIGMTSHTESRLSIFLGHSHPLFTPIYLHTIETAFMKTLELSVQGEFAAYHVRGEWYEFTPDVLQKAIAYVETMNAKLSQGGR